MCSGSDGCNCDSSSDLHWSEAKKREFHREMEAYKMKRASGKLSPMSNTSKDQYGKGGYWLADAVIIISTSTVFSLLLNWIVYPFIFVITHDCGRWFCSHTFSMSWTSFLLTAFVIGLFLLVAFLSDKQTSGIRNTYQRPTQYQNRSRASRNISNTYDDLETDYYDSDMEGAPGYYGGD